MLHSLIASHRRPVKAHLMASPDLSEEALERLSGWLDELGATIRVHRIDESRLHGVGHTFSICGWYRILLPELLPELDRILYLDSDLIVTDSLDPLSRLDVSQHCVAAVTNPPFTPEWSARHCSALGMRSSDDYFNSGVLVMNLDELRRGDYADRILDYAVAHTDHVRATEVDESSTLEAFTYGLNHPERLLFPDQDSVNAVLWERRLKLHPRWNYQLLFHRFEFRTPELTDEIVAEARANPAIRHFEGPGHSKPWHPESDPADRALYWAHRERTPWRAAAASSSRSSP
jgi:poly(ribitol-phosphate) beta-N-acetylglucosaminyltransferase